MSIYEDKVCEKIQKRAAIGLEKYGVSLERTDLSVMQWANHLQEELMDACNYLERFMSYNEPSHEDYVIVLNLMIKRLVTNRPSKVECEALLIILTEFHDIIDEIKSGLELNQQEQLDLPLGDIDDNLSMYE